MGKMKEVLIDTIDGLNIKILNNEYAVKKSNWITFHIGSYDLWCQAKIFDEGSDFGIQEGRVSKLKVCRGSLHNDAQCLYEYDRGEIGRDVLENSILEEIVLALEWVEMWPNY